MKNFKLPLRVTYGMPFNRTNYIRAADYMYFAETSSKEVAETIVLAINTHDQLVNALKLMREHAGIDGQCIDVENELYLDTIVDDALRAAGELP